jgi:hypothetical protein
MADDEAAGCVGCLGMIYFVGYIVAVVVTWNETRSFGKTIVYPLGSWLTVYFGMDNWFQLW